MFLLGKKIGMTHVYGEDGSVVPVTVLQVPTATVVAKPTTPKGDAMVQCGIIEKAEHRLNKPQKGYLQKNGGKLFGKLFSFKENGAHEVGQTLGVDLFEAGTTVDIMGKTKGRGFTGVMKRWNMSGSNMSHGQSKNHRKPASGGATDAGRTFPGTRKPGQYGNEWVTIKNLQVVRTMPEDNLILIKGAVPGHDQGDFVKIRLRKAKGAKA